MPSSSGPVDPASKQDPLRGNVGATPTGGYLDYEDYRDQRRARREEDQERFDMAADGRNQHD